jgi:hypothetical protein
MTIAQKIEKHFGSDAGMWYCRINGCHVIINSTELMSKDKENTILWGRRTNKNSNKAAPICPIHGRFLNYGDNTEKSPNSDVVLQ